MSTTTQDKRLLELQTPLGKDALVIRGIHGREGISHLYSFEIDAFGSNDEPADFSAIVGQPVWVSATLKDHNKRYFHGIVKSFARGARGNFNTAYRMEIVPTLWLLSQRTQSRIFQQMPVPEILKKVLEGIDAEHRTRGGGIADGIDATAREIGADLIVLYRHARGGLSRRMLGSVSDQLIQHATAPVLLMGDVTQTAAGTVG